MPKILWLEKKLTDGTYTVRGQRENGQVLCPGCGQWHPLVEDVDAYRADTGEVVAWGPGLAHCGACHLLILDYWEGTFCYDLQQYEKAETDTVVVTCQGCGKEFDMPRWRFKVEIEEEGEFYCPSCSGVEGVL